MAHQYPNLKPALFSLADSANWSAHLEREGYVVIENIVSDEVNQKALVQFKHDWKTVTPNFDWEDTSTWTSANSPMVWGKSSAMFNGFGQSGFVWLLRTQPAIHEAFSKIYNTQELAVALDGFSVFISPKQKSKVWLHQDQRASDRRLSVQGAVNLKPVGEHDAGFVCVPKSHITHTPAESKTDWVMLDKNDAHYQLAVKLLIPKNCLVLWHSKTIHANTGMYSRHPEKLHLNRLTAYIAFVPKSRQTKEIVQKRVQGYRDGVACSHWADRFEIKKIPFWIRKGYLERGFGYIRPLLNDDGSIPDEYLKLI